MTLGTARDSINIQNNSRRQLLVSVRDAQEAELCLQAGVDWVDLKEPTAGSLGMPQVQSAQQVAKLLADHPRRSVALGELRDLQSKSLLQSASQLCQLFPIAKVGLQGVKDQADWQDQLHGLAQQFSAKLTPVIYADWKRCDAPEPMQVVAWAQSHASRFLLIDTYFKDGQRLLDHFSRQQLESLLEEADQFGTKVVLAGSLSMDDIPTLIDLPCAALAVRGAVCDGRREGKLCAQRIQDWMSALAQPRQEALTGSTSQCTGNAPVC